MGLFKKKKKVVEIEVSADKHNKMWDLWAKGDAISPYAEVMTYQAEVNNGGHDQFFDNVSNTDDLNRVVNILFEVLPEPVNKSFKKAYKFYLKREENPDLNIDNVLEKCDDVFYDNEVLIDNLLSNYSSTL